MGMKKRMLVTLLAISLTMGSVACGKEEAAAPVQEEVVEETVEITEEVLDTETEEEEVEEEEVAPPKPRGLGVNMVVNGDFSDGTNNWSTYLNHGGKCEFSEVDGVAVVDIAKDGSEDYAVQIYYDGLELEQNGIYEFSFDMDTTVARNIEARIQENGGSYHPYYDNYFDIEEGMNHYSFEFTMEDESDPAPRLCFNLGKPKGATSNGEHVIKIDNVAVILKDESNIVRTEVADVSKNINLNQVGFLTKARKTCVVRSEGIDNTFAIIDSQGKEVYTGTLTGPVKSEGAKEKVMQGDFSDFVTPGTYTIKVSNGDDSYPFTIGDDVYDDLLKDTLLMLTRQRCGMEVTEDIAGVAAHPVCHNTKAVIYGTSNKKEVNGGWHDAGDYGRYVVAGVTTVADLLLTYEDYPEIWSTDELGIPESGNGVPDILDEAKYELDWLLKMQDEATGGVYHKVTCREFPGFVMPQEETDELVLSAISNTATGDFAAIMAKASVVYKDIDPEFSAKALDGAIKAYAYLEEHKSAQSFKNPADILTGEYPDGQFKDEMYWASVELYKVTGDEKYKAYFEDSLQNYVLTGFGWSSMGSYGNVAYLSLDEKDQNPELIKKLKEEVTASADEYLNNSKTDGYMVDLGMNYCWGSNLVVCANARDMLMAAQFGNHEAEYKQAAYDQISYILGQNSVSYCFVTGYGSVYAKNAHHRPSIATASVIPGMVIGGPDGNLEDPFTKSTMDTLPPAKVYADNAQSYSTNEVTIYWNSPFLYLLTAEIAQNK